MPTQRKTKVVALPAILAGLLIAPALSAGHASGGVYVNGVELSPQQIEMLRQTTGVNLPTGHYLVQNGCIAHLESGQVQCAPSGGQNYGGGDVYGFGAGDYAQGGDVYNYGYDGYGGESYGYGGGGYGYSNGAGGSWFHRGSDYSGGYSVGGDGSGCVYTPDWSNC